MNDDTPAKNNARRLLPILRRRRLLILLCVVLATGAALVMSLSEQATYQATAKLLVLKSPRILVGNDNPQFSPSSDFDPTTGQSLATLNVVSQEASASMGGRISAGHIRGHVAIDPYSAAGLVLVAAKDTDPRRAAAVATAFASSYAKYLKASAQESYSDAAKLVTDRLDDVDPSSPEAARLREKLDDLRSSAALQNGGLKLAEPAAVPNDPISPKPVNNMAAGLIAGLIVGLALAFLVDALDRRLRDEDDLEEIFSQPVLGHIPLSEEIRGQTRNNGALTPHEAEAFRLLRASMRFVRGGANAKRILITSAASGEGKSTVAWNLALMAARGRSRVLLIEADLRKPQLGRRYIQARSSAGLSEVLSGQATVEQVMVDYEGSHEPEFGRLSVLLAGERPPNPAELLDSVQMRRLLDDMSERFDIVIVDAPPPTVVADPLSLLPLVDGVLVVARLDFTDRRALTRLRDQLDGMGAQTMGLVLNGTTADGRGEYY